MTSHGVLVNIHPQLRRINRMANLHHTEKQTCLSTYLIILFMMQHLMIISNYYVVLWSKCKYLRYYLKIPTIFEIDSLDNRRGMLSNIFLIGPLFNAINCHAVYYFL